MTSVFVEIIFVLLLWIMFWGFCLALMIDEEHQDDDDFGGME